MGRRRTCGRRDPGAGGGAPGSARRPAERRPGATGSPGRRAHRRCSQVGDSARHARAPPCRVGDAAALRGAAPPPGPRLCRRAGNFPAKVILQARPRPRSGWFGVGWTGDLGAAGAAGIPGPVGGCSAGASLPAPVRVSFQRRAALGWGLPGPSEPAPAGELGRPSSAVQGRVVGCRHGNGWSPQMLLA